MGKFSYRNCYKNPRFKYWKKKKKFHHNRGLCEYCYLKRLNGNFCYYLEKSK